VRAGAGAAVGIIAKGMNVHATLGVAVVAGDVPGDCGGARVRGLLKADRTGDFGVTSNDSDWVGKKGKLAYRS